MALWQQLSQLRKTSIKAWCRGGFARSLLTNKAVDAAGIDLRSTLALVWDAETQAHSHSGKGLIISFNPHQAMGKTSN